MRQYCTANDAVVEITRRGGVTAEDRDRPLIENHWRGYPELNNLFTQSCTVDDAMQLLSTACPFLNATADLTNANLRLACYSIRENKILESDQVMRAETNWDKVKALRSINGVSNDSGLVDNRPDNATADATDNASANATTWNATFARGDYKSLVLLVIEAKSLGKSESSIVGVLATAKCPIGIMFLISVTSVPSDVFKQISGAKSPASQHMYINGAISKNSLGENESYGVIISQTAALKIVHGHFGLFVDSTVSDKKKCFNWFEDGARQAIDKKEGTHVLGAILTKEPLDDDPTSFFTRPDLMRLAEPTLVALVAAVGETGRSSGSFSAVYRAILKRAEKIRFLPQGHNARAGLLVKLRAAVQLCFDAKAASCQETYRCSVATASRREEWQLADSASDNKFHEIDELLKRFLDDLALEQLGLGRSPKRSGEAVYTAAQWQEYGSPAKVTRDESLYRATLEKTADQGWGAAARRHGVRSFCEDAEYGTGVAFGNALIIQYNDKNLVTHDFTSEGTCLACLIPEGRGDKWCINPKKCTSHQRPASVPDSATTRIVAYPDLDNSQHDCTSWTVVVPPTVESWSPRKVFGKGKNAAYQSGKGKGQGGGKGGKGKGGYQTGGKGSKGKGRSPDFRRQN